MAERVSYRVEDTIARIRFERPEKLNAIDQVMWKGLLTAFARLKADRNVRVALLEAAGRAFCAGADLRETAWRGEGGIETRRRVERNQQDLARLMTTAPVPIVAAIQGHAIGGGVEIALAADMRIAADDASFAFTEAGIGRFITGAASLLLPRAVGLAWAKRMILTAEPVGAERALAIGLVEEVVPVGELEATALALCAKIAANAPISVQLAKRSLNRVNLVELERALALETDGLIETYGSDDNEAGDGAFGAREKADFRGG